MTEVTRVAHLRIFSILLLASAAIAQNVAHATHMEHIILAVKHLWQLAALAGGALAT